MAVYYIIYIIYIYYILYILYIYPQVAVDITGREKVSTDEKKIAAYVAANGPVSIGLNAAAMQFYTGNVCI